MSRGRRRGGRGRWRGDRPPEGSRLPQEQSQEQSQGPSQGQPSREGSSPRDGRDGRTGRRGLFRRTPGRKEIYLLPTTFTLLNLFFGFAAIVSATKGQFSHAAGFLFLANVCDGLDGRFARMMGATSRMGKELDSLADVVSFGVAPGVLAWQWVFAAQPAGLARLGWLVGFIFLAAAALRLARFNVDDESRPHFLGLPVPMASVVLAATVFSHPAPPQHHMAPLALILGMLALAALMVSRIAFFGLKHLDTRSPRSYIYILPIVLFIVLMMYHPKYAFLFAAYGYLTLNLLGALKRRVFRASAPPPIQPERRPAPETGGRPFQSNRY